MLGLVGTLAKGAVAGAAGTLAMDLVWYGRYRSQGGEQGFNDWVRTDADAPEAAGTGARVVDRAAAAVGTEVPDDRADTVQDVTHWFSGVGNGISHALLHRGRHPLVGGLATGASSLLQARAAKGVADGGAEAVGLEDPASLRKDVGGHLVYGIATGLTHALLRRR